MKAEDAMGQAQITAANYMDYAVTAVAEEVGIINPSDKQRAEIMKDYGVIIAAMIQAAAQDFHTTALTVGLGSNNSLSSSLSMIASAVESTK